MDSNCRFLAGTSSPVTLAREANGISLDKEIR